MALGMLKRSLKYKVIGEGGSWLQNIPFGNVSIFNRVDYLLEQCTDKRVLHVGFSDYPYTLEKISNQSLLHLHLKKVTKSLLGLDIENEAIEQYRELTGDGNILHADITVEYPEEAIHFNPDIILLSEVIEHLQNPYSTIDVLYNSFSNGTKVLVTVPNYTALDTIAASTHKTETIHPQHYWYFSPYTLCRLFDDKHFDLEQLHFGMYYQYKKNINPVMHNFPYNGDCIMAIFLIRK